MHMCPEEDRNALAAKTSIDVPIVPIKLGVVFNINGCHIFTIEIWLNINWILFDLSLFVATI